MNDAIDDAMGDEDDEEERFGDRRQEGGDRGDAWPSGCLALIVLFFLPSDAVVAQVLDELGLSLTDELSSECPDPGPCPARSSAIAQTLPLPALLLPAGALFLTPLLCRPPLHWRLPQCGCQWEESRGCSLRPSRCRRRPGGAAQEPSKGLTAHTTHPHATLGSQRRAQHFHCTFCNKRSWPLVLGLCEWPDVSQAGSLVTGLTGVAQAGLGHVCHISWGIRQRAGGFLVLAGVDRPSPPVFRAWDVKMSSRHWPSTPKKAGSPDILVASQECRPVPQGYIAQLRLAQPTQLTLMSWLRETVPSQSRKLSGRMSCRAAPTWGFTLPAHRLAWVCLPTG